MGGNEAGGRAPPVPFIRRHRQAQRQRRRRRRYHQRCPPPARSPLLFPFPPGPAFPGPFPKPFPAASPPLARHGPGRTADVITARRRESGAAVAVRLRLRQRPLPGGRANSSVSPPRDPPRAQGPPRFPSPPLHTHRPDSARPQKPLYCVPWPVPQPGGGPGHKAAARGAVAAPAPWCGGRDGQQAPSSSPPHHPAGGPMAGSAPRWFCSLLDLSPITLAHEALPAPAEEEEDERGRGAAPPVSPQLRCLYLAGQASRSALVMMPRSKQSSTSRSRRLWASGTSRLMSPSSSYTRWKPWRG